MRVPLVLEQGRVGEDIAVPGGVGRPRRVRAVMRVGSVVVLRPEAVEDKRGMLRAFGSGGMGVAKLRRPGEVEEVEIELGGLAGFRLRSPGAFGGWAGGRGGTTGDQSKKQERQV